MNKKNQSGLTFISGLVLGLIFLGIIILAVKLVPPYVENYMVVNSIRNIVEELEHEPTQSFSDFKRDVVVKFDKHLNINGINRIKHRDLIVTQTSRNFNLGLTYDVKVHIVGNIDAIIHFNDSVKVPRR